MENGIILLADNIKIFTDTRAEFLKRQGYTVYCAYSPAEAEEILKTKWVHLAILDICLRDDDDREDESGLDIAKNKMFGSIPKMMLTGFPSVASVRDALSPATTHKTNIFNYVSKDEGVDEMIKQVNKIFKDFILINRDLKIHWKNPAMASLAHIAMLMKNDFSSIGLQEHLQELEDLLRMVFNDSDQITIARLLWNHDERIALDVTAFSDSFSTQTIVHIGKKNKPGVDESKPEAFNFGNFPGFPQSIGKAQTLNYEAQVWKANHSLADSISLADLLRENGDKRIHAALENLFSNSLDAWYEPDLNIIEGNLDKLYQDLTGSSAARLQPEELKQKIRALLKACVSGKLISDFDYREHKICLALRNGQKLEWQDPSSILSRATQENRIVRRILSPGGIALNALLVDRESNVTLTDFTYPLLVPCERDFVALEAEVHVRANETYTLAAILEMERELATLRSLTDVLQLSEVDPGCRKAVGIIHTIRRLAFQSFQSTPMNYLTGLFYVSLQRFLEFPETVKLTSQEIMPFFHYLVMCCLLVEKLGMPARVEEKTNGVKGIMINETNHEVSIDGRRVNLTPTEYELIRLLASKKGNLCRRDEIMLEVFHVSKPDAASEKSLLNTHMGRLRTKIETDAGNPGYLQTVRGQGYRLVDPDLISG